MKLNRYFLLGGLFMITAFLIVRDVDAHAGGVMQVASQDAGPFKLTVWTSPDPALVGEIHVAAAVASAESALPILDAGVFIELVPQGDQGETLSGQATTEESTNQFLYETIFDVPDEGVYQVIVTATDTEGEEGTVSFALEVESAPPLALGLAALVMLAVVTGGAVWFYLRSTSTQKIEA